MIILQENYSLKSLNTFGIDVKANHYAYIQSINELEELCIHDLFSSQPRLILGGGSNILFTKYFPGCVAHIAIKGIEVVQEDKNIVYIKTGAGESWHDLVLYALEQGYGGIENLSLIPGTVGGAPIQNIGAYGVEFKDVFIELEAIEIATGKIKVFKKEACQFSYRDSVFKHSSKGTFIILNVTLQLQKYMHKLHIDYGIIQATLKEMKITKPSIHTISKAIIHIRQSKLPNPSKLGNAGSFFKNPVVSQDYFKELKETYPKVPGYDMGKTGVKLSAAWLIEKLGWKGKRNGNVGVCITQPLVLVNYGGATGEQIYQLAQAIQDDVANKFAIQLVLEVNIIGLT